MITIIKCSGPFHPKSIPKRKTSVERLCSKIDRDLHFTCDPATFHRIYSGYWQRKAGALSWTMQILNNKVCEICSHYPVKDLLKAKKLAVVPSVHWTNEIEIAPDE